MPSVYRASVWFNVKKYQFFLQILQNIITNSTTIKKHTYMFETQQKVNNNWGRKLCKFTKSSALVITSYLLFTIIEVGK